MATEDDVDRDKTPKRKAPQRRVPSPRAQSQGKSEPSSKPQPPRKSATPRAESRPEATPSPRASARPKPAGNGPARGNGGGAARPAPPNRGPSASAGAPAKRPTSPAGSDRPPAGTPKATPAPSKPNRAPSAEDRRPAAAAGRPAPPDRRAVAKSPSSADLAGATRPAASARPATRGPSRPKPPHQAAAPVDSEPEGGAEPQFHLKRKSNTPVIAVVSVVALLAVGGGIWWVQQQPAKEPDVPVVAKVDKAAEMAAQALADAKQRLAAAEKYWNDNPKEYTEALTRFADLFNRISIAEVKAKAEAQFKAVEQARREDALAVWEGLRDQAQALIDKSEFGDAFKLMENAPPVMNFLTEAAKIDFRSMMEEANLNQLAMQELIEHRIKAVRYVEKEGLPEIAKAILEEFPAKYETEAEAVWAAKEKTVRDFENMQISEWLGREKQQDEFVLAQKRERERLELERREQLWSERVGAVEWQRQLARGHTYNWVVSSDNNFAVDSGQAQPKFVHRKGDDPVLAVDNDTGGELFTGIFTSFWKDYIVEFQARLGDGSFSVSPRTSASLGRGVDYDRSELIEFGPDQNFTRGEWVTVTIEVRGDRVTVTRSDQPGESKVFTEGDEFKLLSEGGFLFVVPDKARVEFKGVRTKLVTHSRERLF